jgi:pyridoxine 5'-phosphate synthase PdxJ
LGYKGSEEALKDAKAEVSMATDASEELKKLAKDRADKQTEIRGDYYGEDYQRATEHKKKLEELGKTFTGDELKRLTAAENTRYEQSTKLAQLQVEQQIYGWQWTGRKNSRKKLKLTSM